MWTAVSIRFATKEIIDTELQIKDLETIDSRIAKVQKQAQTGGDKQAKIAYEVLCKYKEALEQGKSAPHRFFRYERRTEDRTRSIPVDRQTGNVCL